MRIGGGQDLRLGSRPAHRTLPLILSLPVAKASRRRNGPLSPRSPRSPRRAWRNCTGKLPSGLHGRSEPQPGCRRQRPGPGLDSRSAVVRLQAMPQTSPAPVPLARPDREPRSPSERRFLLWLFLTTAGALLLVQEGAITGYDGQTMYEVTKAVVERGDLAVDREWNALPGSDGRFYGRYGIGMTIVGLIPYAAVHAVAGTGDRADALGEAVVSATMPLIAAGLVVATYLLARRL